MGEKPRAREFETIFHWANSEEIQIGSRRARNLSPKNCNGTLDKEPHTNSPFCRKEFIIVFARHLSTKEKNRICHESLDETPTRIAHFAGKHLFSTLLHSPHGISQHFHILRTIFLDTLRTFRTRFLHSPHFPHKISSFSALSAQDFIILRTFRTRFLHSSHKISRSTTPAQKNPNTRRVPPIEQPCTTLFSARHTLLRIS